MLDSGSWNVISEGKSNRVILGIDFPAPGRAEGTFTELAARLGSEYGFLQTVPPRVSPDQRILAEEYTWRWIDEALRDKRQVVAVLGYCLGSVYAAPVYEGISERQDKAPALILFDPLHADVRLIAREAQKIIGNFGPLLSDDETELAMKRIAELTEPEQAGSAGLADVAVGLVGFYREVGSAAFGRLGLNEARRNEMIQLLDSYMSWMSVAAQISPFHSWKRSTAMMSIDYVSYAAEAGSADAWGEAFGQRIALDVAHGDLLRSESTVNAVLGKIENL